jgi:hypothetical protein
MKLRFALPAALAVGAALAIPSGASADPPNPCPDHFTPTFIIFGPPDAADKDHNNNGIVCHKDTPGQGDPTKDDNGFIISFIDDPDPTNWADDVF